MIKEPINLCPKKGERMFLNPHFTTISKATFDAYKAIQENIKLSGPTKIYDPRYVDHVIYGDGIPLFSSAHPRPKFNLWRWVKYIFIRPRFSVDALENHDRS